MICTMISDIQCNVGIERDEHTAATGFLRLTVEALYLVAVGTETHFEIRDYIGVCQDISVAVVHKNLGGVVVQCTCSTEHKVIKLAYTSHSFTSVFSKCYAYICS